MPNQNSVQRVELCGTLRPRNGPDNGEDADDVGLLVGVAFHAGGLGGPDADHVSQQHPHFLVDFSLSMSEPEGIILIVKREVPRIQRRQTRLKLQPTQNQGVPIRLKSC